MQLEKGLQQLQSVSACITISINVLQARMTGPGPPAGTRHLLGPKGRAVLNWTQGEKRGRVSRVLSASPLPLLAQELPRS
eukprot:1758262-Pyramimonas_sp.AAC.3